MFTPIEYTATAGRDVGLGIKRFPMTTQLKFLAAALSAISAFGQRPQGGPPGAGPGMDGLMLLRAATQRLDLTADQKDQAQSIVQDALRGSRPLAEEVREARTAIDAAIKAGKSDDELAALAEKQAASQGKMLVAMVKAEAHFWGILSAEQREKFDRLKAEARRQRMRPRPRND